MSRHATATPTKPVMRPPAVRQAERVRVDEEEPLVGLTEPGGVSLQIANLKLTHVHDDDVARAMVTRLLIEELASCFGVNLDHVEVHVDADAAVRVNARGASGLQEGAAIFLHPDRYQPQQPFGRQLLAHEAVHVLQRTVSRETGDVAQAEREADRIARNFAERRVVRAPQVRLPSLASSADSDVTPDPLFDANAPEARIGELAYIKRKLGGLWVSDGDVDDILTLLATQPRATALALVRALEPGQRYDLVNNINDHHYNPFRQQVLLVYEATPRDQIREKFDEDLLVDMDLSNLSNDEVFAVDHVVRSLKPKAKEKLLKSRVGRLIPEIEKAADNPANLKRHDDDYRESVAEEAKKQDELKERRASAVEALDDIVKGPGLKATIEHIRAKLGAFVIRDADALETLDLIQPYANDSGALQAIADGLITMREPTKRDPDRREEDKDYLNVLLDEIPVGKLYGGTGQRLRVLVRLMSFRAAYKNVALARKLINATFSNSEDAFLALNLVKALPESEQQAFVSAGGGKTWSDIISGLSLSQREALSLNLYTGGKAQGDRNALLMQLMDDKVWAEPMRLSGLIRMAIAAGQYAWAFAESQRRIRDKASMLDDPALLAIIEKYGLYNPRPTAQLRDGRHGPRTSFDPDAYKPASYRGRHWYQESPFKYFAMAAEGLDFLGKTKSGVLGMLWSYIFDPTVEVRGAPIAEAQDVTGGDLAGITFERPEDLGIAGRDAIAKKEGVNYMDADWRPKGALKARASELAIANLHIPLGAAKLESGRGRIGRLDVELRYATKAERVPSIIDVYIGALELQDVTMVLPDSMVGAETFGLAQLRILAREIGDPRADPRTKLGLLAVGLGSLFKPNLPRAVELTFGKVTAKGVSTSAGQYVSSLEMKDVSISGGGSSKAYREALELSAMRLRTRIARETKQAALASDRAPHDKVVAQLEKQLRNLSKELGEFQVLDALEARRNAHQKNPEKVTFTTADERKLAELDAKFSGAVVDVGSVAAEGITGMPVTRFGAQNIHGQGRALSAFFGTGFATQLLQGASVVQPGPRKDAKFSLDVGSIETSAIDVVGGIPSPDQAQKDLDRFSKTLDFSAPGHMVRLGELHERAQDAAAYERLLSRGVENLAPDDRRELFTLRSKLEAYEAGHAFHVGKLAVEGASISADERGELSAQADVVDAEDVREAGSGTRVERVSGRAVKVSAEVKGGVFGLRDWRKNVSSGSLGAGQLDFSNIRHEGSGAVVKSLSLKKANVSATRSGRATMTASSIDVANVDITVTRELLEAERTLIQSVLPAFRRERDQQRLAAIDSALSELASLDRALAKAATALDQARAKGKGPAVRKAEAAVESAEKARLTWQQQLVVKGLSLQDLDIAIEGIGDILDADFDIARALRNGISIRGTGPGGRMISGASLTDSRIPGLSGKEVKLGPTGGAVTVSERGLELKGFFIDSLLANGLDYQGGGNHVWSKGTSLLTKLSIDAKLENREIENKFGPSQWVPSKLTLTRLSIARVQADRLGYASQEKGIEIGIESGAIEKLSAENLVVELPDTKDGDVKVSGKGKIGAIKEMNVRAVIGHTLSVKGVLSGSDLRAELFGDAAQKYHIGDLSVREGEISDPAKGTVKISVAHLSGDVAHRRTKTGDEYDLRNIKLGSMTLAKSSTWETDGTKLEILGGASLTKFSATATVQRRKVGDKYQIEQVLIPHLAAERIEARDVHLTTAARAADVKAGTKAQAPKSVTLASATITGFGIEGFDLVQGLGDVKTDTVDVKDLGVEIASKGEKAFKKGNVSVKGTGLKGKLTGPGKASIDLGHIESLSGSYSDNETTVKNFSASDLTGNVAIGPDYVHVEKLNAGPVKLGRTDYADTNGNKVGLDGVDITAVHLVDLWARFTEDKATEEQKLSSVEVNDLRFDRITAGAFSYVGDSTKLDPKGQAETSHIEMKAQKAMLEPLHIENANLDLLKHIHHVKADIDKASLTSFTGVFTTKVAGDVVKRTELAASVTGSALRADLTFAQVKLADTSDWTRTTGTFHLGKLGLASPGVTVSEEEKGVIKKKLQVLGLDPGAAGGIDLTGLDVSLSPNGTVLVKLDDVAAHGLKVRSETAGKLIDIGIPIAQIKGVTASLRGLGTAEGIGLLAAETGKISTQGLRVDIHIDRKVTPDSAGASSTPEKFLIKPLADAEGNLRLMVPYELFKDVNVPLEELVLPVHKGSIDLDSLILRGIVGEEEDRKEKDKKKYALSIDDKGLLLTVDHPKLPTFTYHVPTTEGRPGLYKNRGKHGTIVLEELLESYLNEPSGGTKTGTPTDFGFLDYLGLEKSDFQLGTGRIGTDSNFIDLSQPTPGANLIHIVESVLGKDLSLSTASLNASGAGFAVTENEGPEPKSVKRGSTGAIGFTNVKVRIAGLGKPSFEFDIHLETDKGEIASVSYGDLSLLNPAALTAQPGPAVVEGAP